MATRPGAALAAVLLGLGFVAGCSRSAPAPIGCGEIPRAAAPAGVSVIVFVNDTMRRDRLGIHGGPAHTPNFDGLAREGLWFRQAVAQAPWTKPSVATLFTSLHPAQHGVVTHPAAQRRAGEQLGRPIESSDRLDPAAETLAEVFRAAGFRTAAFVANPWMDRRFGFDQGFETYDDSFARWEVPGRQVVDSALTWLAQLDPDERFLLYVHTIDSHRPYPPLTWPEVESALAGPPITGPLGPDAAGEISRLIRTEGARPPGAELPPERRLLRRAYDKGIERFDEALGDLLHAIERDPRRERIAMIVTSDHGEALFDRGYGNHGLGLYEDELAIPLVADLPGIAAGPVDCRVGLVDLMPTLCDWLGIECPARMAGHSLFLGRPGTEDLGGRYVGRAAILDPRSRAVYRGAFKLLFQPGLRPETNPPDRPWSLFDLQRDPHEEHDLLATGSGTADVERIVTALRGEIEEADREEGGAVLAPGETDLDPAMRERLRSLGYIE